MKFIKTLFTLVLVLGIVGGFFLFRERYMRQSQPRKEDLSATLNSLFTGTQVSLNQVDSLDGLVSWARETDLSPDEASGAIKKWAAELTPEKREQLLQQLKNLGEDAGQYLKDNAGDLLEKLGLGSDPSGWKDKLNELLK